MAATAGNPRSSGLAASHRGVIETDLAGPDLRDDLGKRAPLGRLGQPNGIAATVSWLVSLEASFVTGSDLTVSGGL
jgi:NAD(P)-dependent dehydrogenase (short-subunit alcohol dehydrogenase family)